MKSTERKKTKPKTLNELPDLLTITQAARLLNVHNDAMAGEIVRVDGRARLIDMI